jgi:hypothetical protein
MKTAGFSEKGTIFLVISLGRPFPIVYHESKFKSRRQRPIDVLPGSFHTDKFFEVQTSQGYGGKWQANREALSLIRGIYQRNYYLKRRQII